MFAFELRGEPTPELERLFAERIVERVRELSADFRTALEEGDAARPVVRLHAAGTGPFAADATRIKQRRIAAPQ